MIIILKIFRIALKITLVGLSRLKALFGPLTTPFTIPLTDYHLDCVLDYLNDNPLNPTPLTIPLTILLITLRLPSWLRHWLPSWLPLELFHWLTSWFPFNSHLGTTLPASIDFLNPWPVARTFEYDDRSPPLTAPNFSSFPTFTLCVQRRDYGSILSSAALPKSVKTFSALGGLGKSHSWFKPCLRPGYFLLQLSYCILETFTSNRFLHHKPQKVNLIKWSALNLFTFWKGQLWDKHNGYLRPESHCDALNNIICISTTDCGESEWMSFSYQVQLFSCQQSSYHKDLKSLSQEFVHDTYQKQCDQIEPFLKGLDNRFSCKSNPNITNCFENINFK